MIAAAKNNSDSRQIRLSGIHRVTMGGGEKELFEAYLEFAFHRSMNDAEIYEAAAATIHIDELKFVFSQLACRKQEVVHRLGRNRSQASPAAFIHESGPTTSAAKRLQGPAAGSLGSLWESFEFAFKKEHTTLEHYKKLAKSVHLTSLQMLFDYLVESQQENLLFLSTRLACVNGNLDPPASARSAGGSRFSQYVLTSMDAAA